MIFLQAECHFALIPGRLHESRIVARREESGQVTTLTQTCGSQRRVSSGVSRPGGGGGGGARELRPRDHGGRAAPGRAIRRHISLWRRPLIGGLPARGRGSAGRAVSRTLQLQPPLAV